MKKYVKDKEFERYKYTDGVPNNDEGSESEVG